MTSRWRLAALLISGLAAVRASAGTVNVLYAGSLVQTMEHALGPAYDRASGDRFRGYPGGSNQLANEIKGRLRRADVFVSANPKVNDELTGAANGAWETWYVSFAQSPLVIGYYPHSRFAAQLRRGPWQKVLSEPGFRLGRTDPRLDPKGKLTIAAMKKAAAAYHDPDLVKRVLGDPESSPEILPEEVLVGRLESGALDAGFFYSTEAAEAHIPSIALPPEAALKATYTASILRDAPDPAAARRFVDWLLGEEGRALLKAHGLITIPPELVGDAAAAPPGVARLAAGR